jgi:superfamily II DNA or RNA helicase
MNKGIELYGYDISVEDFGINTDSINKDIRAYQEVYGAEIKSQISKETKKKLKSHQIKHVNTLITKVKNRKQMAVLDGSEPGTGKTHSACATCYETKRKPFVICKKSNISNWLKVLKEFDIEPLGVVNYELIRKGKYYVTSTNDDTKRLVVADCPYITRINNRYIWDFSSVGTRNCIVIFDEVHECKKKTSLSGKLLMACKKIKTLMLSASLCDKLDDFMIFGYMLDFYKLGSGKKWMERLVRDEKRKLLGKVDCIRNLDERLYPEKGSKMFRSDMEVDELENIIEFKFYTVSDEDRQIINKLHSDYEKKLKERKLEHDNNSGNNKIAKLSKIKGGDRLAEYGFKMEKIENIKVSIIMDRLVTYHKAKLSIVVFIKYRSTLDMIRDNLTKLSIDYSEIMGGQSIEERDENITAFQNNEVRVIVCIVDAGADSISLHDKLGNQSRVSLISPSYSVQTLKQILGRLVRVDRKSRCIQEVIFCADTCEEHIAQTLLKKNEFQSLVSNNTFIDVNTDNIPDNIHKKNNIHKNNDQSNSKTVSFDDFAEQLNEFDRNMNIRNKKNKKTIRNTKTTKPKSKSKTGVNGPIRIRRKKRRSDW